MASRETELEVANGHAGVVASSQTADAAGNGAVRRGKLLLVTAVRLRQGPRGLQLDDQTCAGVCQWAQHFDTVTFLGIRQNDEVEDATSITWVDVASLPCHDRLDFVALPFAYRFGAFLKAYGKTRARIADEIRKADHMSFTVGYLVGDWAAIAALEAIDQGRDYAIWFDRVEQDVLRNTLHALSLKRQIKERASLPIMIRYHRHLLRRSSLALLQGMDTFSAYAPYASNPACVYDVHTQPDDFIGPGPLAAKIAVIESGAPLRIAYVGRAAEMKGSIDWLRAIASAKQRGVALQARWLGDGPLLAQMKDLVASLELSDCVELAGYVSDRELILAAMRDCHLFLFCHKTPESPRCLIEALVCGSAIVGYRGAYPEGLIAGTGGGLFCRMNDIEALAELIVKLDEDRPMLAQLVRDAAVSGRQFDEEKLYRHRAELIADHA